MTVNELMRFLVMQDQNALVVLAKDELGCSFSPLSEVAYGVYIPENSFSGAFGEAADYVGNEEAMIAVGLYPTMDLLHDEKG